MKPLNITIYTLLLNNYIPNLSKITIPSIKRYANRINVNFEIISKRKFPDYPINYEKLQVFELGKDNDLNIFIDADILIHPDMRDISKIGIPLNMIASPAKVKNLLTDKGRAIRHFRRYGEDLSISTSFVITSRMTHDVWQPLDMSYDEACSYIVEPHFVDEFCLGMNIAKYGLPYTGFSNSGTYKYIHFGANTENEDVCVKKAKRLKELWKT